MKRMEIMLDDVKEFYEKINNNNDIDQTIFLPKIFKFDDETLQNKGLTAHERMVNIRDHLGIVDNSKIKNKCVIVIDDVVTSGASLFFAYINLHKEGASKVSCMALTKSIS